MIVMVEPKHDPGKAFRKLLAVFLQSAFGFSMAPDEKYHTFLAYIFVINLLICQYLSMQSDSLMPTILFVSGSTAMTLAPSMTQSLMTASKAGHLSLTPPDETVIGSPD